MDFSINTRAEARVLVPWEHIHDPSTAMQDSSAGVDALMGAEFDPYWKGDSNVWEAFRLTCPPTSRARRLSITLQGQGFVPRNLSEAAGSLGSIDEDFRFTPTLDDEFDFCDRPWAHYLHGHFFSDWRTIHALYPVFSYGKGKGFSDILIPSHFYHSPTSQYTYGFDPVTGTTKEEDDLERPWQNKTNKIFWRGATTGGGSSPRGHINSYQRHR
jgi:hypothetical protein